MKINNLPQRQCVMCGAEFSGGFKGLCSNCAHCTTCGQFLTYRWGFDVYECADCHWQRGDFRRDLRVAFRSNEATWPERCDYLLSCARSVNDVLDVYHAWKQACVEFGTHLETHYKEREFYDALTRIHKESQRKHEQAARPEFAAREAGEPMRAKKGDTIRNTSGGCNVLVEKVTHKEAIGKNSYHPHGSYEVLPLEEVQPPPVSGREISVESQCRYWGYCQSPSSCKGCKGAG